MAEAKENRIAVCLEGVSKEYRRGEYDRHTFKAEWIDWWERHRLSRPGETTSGASGRGERFMALENIDLTIHRGEVLGIIGHNGAGKSTMLKLISRITTPTVGTIRLYGRVASLLEVGCGFHPDMTGRENVYLNGAILGMRRAEIDRKLQDIIDFSEVGEFIDTPVKRYSSGMHVKLAFAVAAHLDSEIMIMDEILAVGDMSFQKKCLRKMRQAAVESGRTILYVSHNMSTIRSLCDRCIVLDHGKKVFEGDVNRAIAVYLGTEAAEKVRYTYDASYRPYDQILRANLRLEVEELTILEGGPVFSAAETRRLRIRCRALRPLRRVCFRFELWFEDGSKVGTMLSAGGTDLAEGENDVELVFDPAHLCGGQYSADLVVYQYDDDGNEDILDGVYPGWLFQILNPADDNNYLDWHHQYWGHIRLHDMEVRGHGAETSGA